MQGLISPWLGERTRPGCWRRRLADVSAVPGGTPRTACETQAIPGKLNSVRNWVLAVSVLVVLGGCAYRPTLEPPNLQPHKQQVRSYIEGGDYHREIEAVVARARAWIERRAAQGGAGLTVVFDLDETLWSNWPLIKQQDFGYVPAEWDRWVADGRAPAIEPVRDLFLAARRLGVDVVFITGRRERDRAGAERNLRAIGCTDYARLICKQDSDTRTSTVIKTSARQKLVAEGRTVIANVGDQASDLSGGFAERSFKLPNPFYLTE